MACGIAALGCKPWKTQQSLSHLEPLQPEGALPWVRAPRHAAGGWRYRSAPPAPLHQLTLAGSPGRHVQGMPPSSRLMARSLCMEAPCELCLRCVWLAHWQHFIKSCPRSRLTPCLGHCMKQCTDMTHTHPPAAAAHTKSKRQLLWPQLSGFSEEGALAAQAHLRRRHKDARVRAARGRVDQLHLPREVGCARNDLRGRRRTLMVILDPAVPEVIALIARNARVKAKRVGLTPCGVRRGLAKLPMAETETATSCTGTNRAHDATRLKCPHVTTQHSLVPAMSGSRHRQGPQG